MEAQIIVSVGEQWKSSPLHLLVNSEGPDTVTVGEQWKSRPVLLKMKSESLDHCICR